MKDINIQSVMDFRGEYCVSIYMPTTTVPTDWNENSIRMKNLIRKAASDLEKMNAGDGLVEQLTRPLRDLQEDTRFLQEMKRGAVFFSGPDYFQYHLLPVEVQEFAMVGDRFFIKPLFHLATYNTRYYLLALSKHQVSLYEADRFSLEKLEIPDAPRNIEEFLRFDEEREHLQFHTGTPSQGQQRPAVFHGQGVGSDKRLEKEQSERYIKAVEQAVAGILRTKENLPLVLLAVESMQGIYRKENTFENLAAENIPGNPDRLKPDELLMKGWEVAAGIVKQNIHDAVHGFQEESEQNRTIGKIDEVLQAAFSGRVLSLFVSYEDLFWGEFNEETLAATKHDQWKPGAEDLLETALRFTWLNGGGRVYVLHKEHMPGHALVAAVFRY